MTSIVHLVRRAVTSFSTVPPRADGIARARSVLNDAEFSLWDRMQNRDKRHSLVVLARFEALRPEAGRDARAAALLHDVGKTGTGLGWFMRIVATLAGPRGRRFAEYHDHERIGASMLRTVSSPRTVDLVSMTVEDDEARALRAADDI